MSSILFERVMDMKFSNKPKSVGSFASNLKEFDTVRNFFSSASLAAIVDLPFALIFLIVTYFIGSYLVLVPIVIMIAILCYTFFIKDPLQNAIKSTFEASAMKNGILIESLSSLETIKTLGASGHVQWNWEEATGEIANRSINQNNHYFNHNCDFVFGSVKHYRYHRSWRLYDTRYTPYYGWFDRCCYA